MKASKAGAAFRTAGFAFRRTLLEWQRQPGHSSGIADAAEHLLPQQTMQLTPIIAIHMAAALAAVALGPFVLWTRLGGTVRPRWHRALGYGWTTLMVATAVSAIFIRDFRLPNVAGYTPIHLFVVLTAFYLYRGFLALRQGDFVKHRRCMQSLYISACLVAGIFTLLPQRYLGQLIWGNGLGLV